MEAANVTLQVGIVWVEAAKAALQIGLSPKSCHTILSILWLGAFAGGTS